jgi:hypothetical protein
MKRMLILLALAAAAPIMGMDVHAKLPSHALDGPSEKLRALQKQEDESYKGFQAAQHYYANVLKVPTLLQCREDAKQKRDAALRRYNAASSALERLLMSKHGRCL